MMMQTGPCFRFDNHPYREYSWVGMLQLLAAFVIGPGLAPHWKEVEVLVQTPEVWAFTVVLGITLTVVGSLRSRCVLDMEFREIRHEWHVLGFFLVKSRKLRFREIHRIVFVHKSVKTMPSGVMAEYVVDPRMCPGIARLLGFPWVPEPVLFSPYTLSLETTNRVQILLRRSAKDQEMANLAALLVKVTGRPIA